MINKILINNTGKKLKVGPFGVEVEIEKYTIQTFEFCTDLPKRFLYKNKECSDLYDWELIVDLKKDIPNIFFKNEQFTIKIIAQYKHFSDIDVINFVPDSKDIILSKKEIIYHKEIS